MNLRLFILGILIFISAGLSTSCGFSVLNQNNASKRTISATGSNEGGIYNGISGVFVKPFKDVTYKSGYGAYFSGSIADYLNTYEAMFTANKGDASYFLTGRIVSIQNSVMSYTGVAAAVDYMITVGVKVSLYETGGKIIFRNVNFSSNATYYNYINPLTAHKQEKAAVKKVSQRIARKIAIYIESMRIVKSGSNFQN